LLLSIAEKLFELFFRLSDKKEPPGFWGWLASLLTQQIMGRPGGFISCAVFPASVQRLAVLFLRLLNLWPWLLIYHSHPRPQTPLSESDPSDQGLPVFRPRPISPGTLLRVHVLSYATLPTAIRQRLKALGSRVSSSWRPTAWAGPAPP